ncbi:hypothetical protein D3C71_1099150 [compost metagenome]
MEVVAGHHHLHPRLVRLGYQRGHPCRIAEHLHVDQLGEAAAQQRGVERGIVGVADRLAAAFGLGAERDDHRLAVQRACDALAECDQRLAVGGDVQVVDAPFGDIGGGAGGDRSGLLQRQLRAGPGDRHDGARRTFADAQRADLQRCHRQRRGVGDGRGAAEQGGQNEGSGSAHQKVTLACTPNAQALSVRV